MCVLAGIIVFSIGESQDFSLHGASAPGFCRVGGPAGISKRQGHMAQSSGGTRTNYY
jgi:hypothetical protein